MTPSEFPEPGSPVTEPAIYGPAGPNGEPPHMTMSQFQQWQRDQTAAIIAATPAPPGYSSYADYLAGVKHPDTPATKVQALSPVTVAMASTSAPVSVKAAPLTTSHGWHINLGQVIGLAFLGLQAYNIQDAPGSGPKVLLNQQNSGAILQGILSLFPPAPAAQ